MVDLTKVTNFKRTQAELEEFWLVAICVAGKNGPIQAQKVHDFLKGHAGRTPFEKIRKLINKNELLKQLLVVKMGQYKRIERAFRKSVDLDLKKSELEDLVQIPGVGNKTSRFFLLHSRADCEYVVLDTHILRFLRDKCGLKNIPKSTPTNLKKYIAIETVAREAIRAKFPQQSMAEADLKIWLTMSGRISAF
jgi:thermostable 8-oxoguanine DNA glycosylase